MKGCCQHSCTVEEDVSKDTCENAATRGVWNEGECVIGCCYTGDEMAPSTEQRCIQPQCKENGDWSPRACRPGFYVEMEESFERGVDFGRMFGGSVGRAMAGVADKVGAVEYDIFIKAYTCDENPKGKWAITTLIEWTTPDGEVDSSATRKEIDFTKQDKYTISGTALEFEGNFLRFAIENPDSIKNRLFIAEFDPVLADKMVLTKRIERGAEACTPSDEFNPYVDGGETDFDIPFTDYSVSLPSIDWENIFSGKPIEIDESQ